MSCKRVLPKAFVTAELGKKYMKEVYKPFHLESQVQTEKQLLRLAQPFADWELERRRIVSLRRFRVYETLPPPPNIPDVHVTDNFPCPDNSCRGFVFGTECGVCKKKVCMMCRECRDISPEGTQHVCNEDSVKSLTVMLSDSKPCPKCATYIHRTEGCDHMKCTYCGSHFNYQTLMLIASSTNHHYDNTAPLNMGTNEANSSRHVNELCELDMSDGIPRSAFAEKIDTPEVSDVERILYDDRNMIRMTKDHMYDEQKILTKANKKLHDLRVKFLLKEVTEERWVSSIRSAHEARDKELAIAQLLNIMLNTTKSIQRLIYRGDMTLDAAWAQLQQLYAMMDEQFREISCEYGGSTRLHIRSDIRNFDEPPIIII